MGVTGAMGWWLLSQAYRLAEAAFAAPFEYAALIMAVIWGLSVFGTVPDVPGRIGIALILASGFYLLWRNARAQTNPEAQA